VGDRGEARVALNATRGSLCCVTAELFLSRRPGGYCPDVQPHQMLPFEPHCLIDNKVEGAYVPDEATARAAEQAICGIPSCVEAVSGLVAQGHAQGVALAVPQCEQSEADQPANSVPLEYVAVAIAAAAGAVAAIALLHLVITPWWLRRHAPAKTKPHLSGGSGKAISLQPVDVALGFEEHSGWQKPRTSQSELPAALAALAALASAPAVVPEEPPGLPPPLVLGFSDPPSKAVDLEPAVLVGVLEERMRCRAHIMLFCGSGLGATLTRLSLTLVTTSPTAVAGLLVIALCIWQLALSVRVWFSPVILPKVFCHAARSELCAYVASTLICEAVVLLTVAGVCGPGSRRGLLVGGVDAALAEDRPALLWAFVLDQLAVSLVLVRLYVAWLAHGLHRLRTELTFTVVPQSPKAMLCEQGPAVQRPRALDALVPAWEPEEGGSLDPAARATRAVGRRRALRRALVAAVASILLVFTAAGVGIWRAQTAKDKAVSSCSTAVRGADFCVPTSILGLFIEATSFQECCTLCDLTTGCDAWSFVEGPGTPGSGRCWRMEFIEAPCSNHPGHADCQCHTRSNRISGYKPTPGPLAQAGDG